ncbi:MAG: hypothetical protein ACYDAR_17180 [Thermomicrobiales bacterium]
MALLLAFVFIVQQVATSAAPHLAAMPMASADTRIALNPLSCDGMCASAIVHLCLPASGVCAAIVATLTYLPMSALLVLALIVIAAVAATPRSRSVAPRSWLWPADRRRALLQVFLI